MEQPLGYIAQGEIKVFRLKKVIYGLKKSPRTWFEKFSLTISSIGFTCVIQITLSSFGSQSLAT